MDPEVLKAGKSLLLSMDEVQRHFNKMDIVIKEALLGVHSPIKTKFVEKAFLPFLEPCKSLSKKVSAIQTVQQNLTTMGHLYTTELEDAGWNLISALKSYVDALEKLSVVARDKTKFIIQEIGGLQYNVVKYERVVMNEISEMQELCSMASSLLNDLTRELNNAI